ncbi:MAG: non-hydrolyzing UDP-N-acetylglucosamine 2-epimerase [Candidatus Binatia bacterium]
MASVSVCLVAGARPNFMKVAPVYRALAATPGLEPMLVHTGQHYDEGLSEVFFRDLAIPEPEIHLGVGSGSHGAQTARILERFENVLAEREPGVVVVVGDVNSTLACSLAASKTVYRSGKRPKIAHVEAGLRSFDRTMPEEVNRVLTDAISDFLFVTEESAVVNLRREGIPEERVFFVGNVMIDTLLAHAERAVGLRAWEHFDVEPEGYALLTLHRPRNVDDPDKLLSLMRAMEEIGAGIPVLFPVHPRTANRLRDVGFDSERNRNGRLRLVPPVGYLDFVGLMARAKLVLTDSGGIQEETTILRIPCLTLRENTERPVTVEQGTNTIVGSEPGAIFRGVAEILAGRAKQGRAPTLWDGKAAERIVQVLARRLLAGV